MKSEEQHMNILKLFLKEKILKNGQQGGALAMAMMGLLALMSATYVVMNLNNKQEAENLDLSQRDVIARATENIKNILADDNQCSLSMNTTPPFTQIGEYSAGMSLEKKTSIKTISSSLSGRDYTITILFEKLNSVKKTSTRQVERFHAKLINPGASATCFGYEISTPEESQEQFCQSTGGVFNTATGICNYGASLTAGSLKTQIYKYACSFLGASIVGNRCDKLNIPGPLYSSTRLSPDQKIKQAGTQRSNFLNHTCPTGSISIGINENGTLNCQTVNCTQQLAAHSGIYSNYILDTSKFSSNRSLQCKCTRDFKFGLKINGINTAPSSPSGSTNFGCGGADENSCIDYYYDDGCGTGTKCLIVRGKYPGCSKTTTEKQEILVNSCGDVCAVGPNCNASGTCIPAPPLPPSTNTCNATTLSGCILPISGASTSSVTGKCSVDHNKFCSASCNSAGTYFNINSSNCIAPPIDGVCSSIAETCSTGIYSNQTDSTTHYYWKCLGISGGLTESCSKAKPISGVCSTTLNTCSVGSFQDLPDTSTYAKWSCIGSNGGSTASCSKEIDVINGECATTHYSCAKGISSNTSSTPGAYNMTLYKWNCISPNTGTTAECQELVAPTVCSTTHADTCETGLFIDGSGEADSSGNWKWTCNYMFNLRTCSIKCKWTTSACSSSEFKAWDPSGETMCCPK